jgi:hypothetical protein
MRRQRRASRPQPRPFIQTTVVHNRCYSSTKEVQPEENMTRTKQTLYVGFFFDELTSFLMNAFLTPLLPLSSLFLLLLYSA